jgi:hypothetical protein
MLKVRNEKALFGLQFSVLIRINASCLQVGVECGLSWQLALIDLFRPEWVLAQVLPGDTLHRVLFKKAAQKVVEDNREALYVRERRVLNLGD